MHLAPPVRTIPLDFQHYDNLYSPCRWRQKLESLGCRAELFDPRLAVLMELRLVTDGQADRGTYDRSIYRRAAKIEEKL